MYYVNEYYDVIDGFISKIYIQCPRNGYIRGLSGKFADTANKTRNMYPRLKKFCIKKYQLSSTNYI